ncbi:MAG: aminotransferase class I/II-fold pyridoxal phosphate-dependent enzyme [Acutalibacteraceae bacterium]
MLSILCTATSRFPDAYYDAIIKWHADRHHATVTKEAIGYENGVLGGVATALQAFTAPGEPILIHSPTYIGFTGTITNNGRKIVHSELYRDEEGVWRMDYEDMDKKIKENHIHVCIFCNPHNPCGRVWTREEIERLWKFTRTTTASLSPMRSGLTWL